MARSASHSTQRPKIRLQSEPRASLHPLSAPCGRSPDTVVSRLRDSRDLRDGDPFVSRSAPACRGPVLRGRERRRQHRANLLGTTCGEIRSVSLSATRASEERPAPCEPWRWATRSCGLEGDVPKLRTRFTMLEAVGHDAEGQGFGFRNSLGSRPAIGHNARQLKDFSDPPPVVFLFQLDRQDHRRLDKVSYENSTSRAPNWLSKTSRLSC